MAGPLLGLLAMGGALAARPHLEQYENRVAGRAFERAMQGVDQSDPGAVRRAMGAAGLLEPSMVMGDLRTEFEGTQDRAQREAASRRSAGVSRQNALDRLVQTQAIADREWMVNPLNPESPNYRDGLTPYQHASLELQETASNREYLSGLRDQARLDRERQSEFVNQQQPLVNQLAAIDYALETQLDQASFDRDVLSDLPALNARAAINELIGVRQSRYHYGELGRTDAPDQTEIKRYEDMFPQAGPGIMDEHRRGMVRRQLEVLRAQILEQIMANERVFPSADVLMPNVQPSNPMPPGARIVQ